MEREISDLQGTTENYEESDDQLHCAFRQHLGCIEIEDLRTLPVGALLWIENHWGHVRYLVVTGSGENISLQMNKRAWLGEREFLPGGQWTHDNFDSWQDVEQKIHRWNIFRIA